METYFPGSSLQLSWLPKETVRSVVWAYNHLFALDHQDPRWREGLISPQDLFNATNIWWQWQQDDLTALEEIELEIDGIMNIDTINEIDAFIEMCEANDKLLDGKSEWYDDLLSLNNGKCGREWEPTSRLLDISEMAPDMAKFEWGMDQRIRRTAHGALLDREFKIDRLGNTKGYSVGLTTQGEKLYIPNKYIFGGHNTPIEHSLMGQCGSTDGLMNTVFKGIVSLNPPKDKLPLKLLMVRISPHLYD